MTTSSNEEINEEIILYLQSPTNSLDLDITYKYKISKNYKKSKNKLPGKQ